MNKKKHLLLVALLIHLPCALAARSILFSTQQKDENSLEVSVHFSLDPDEWLYKDSMSFTVDNPEIIVSPFKSLHASINRYDPAFKKTKKIFESEAVFTLDVTKKSNFHDDAYLHVISTTNKQGPSEELYKVTFGQPTGLHNNQPDLDNQNQKKPAEIIIKKAHINESSKTEFQSLSTYISNLVKTIQSPIIRFFLVFLLGILLSLTPCIYPMVPITVGILQAQGSKSFIYNFLLALSYTCGLATTFALFGLLASCTGPLCGRLLMEPLFIGGLVIVLGYLGLSMFGFYEIYVPNFFKNSTKKSHGGSLFSTFVFGAASGTFASPCVSPGLALLLSIVATLGSKLLGFLLLFVFGIGLSMPLLLVGTFSSSLDLLPRAGMWMVEIKKLFGFVIFGMCFYYISYIVPFSILSWFIALFVAMTGIYYIYSGLYMPHTTAWKKVISWIGVLLLASSILLFFQAYRAITYAHVDEYDAQKHLWHTEYEPALIQAHNENKKLFIDFWAVFCPVCLAINKTVFTKQSIIDSLQHFTLLKVDGTHTINKPFNQLKEKYMIQGFPTFLLVDPTTETVIKEWGSEIYSMPNEQLIKEFEFYY